MEKSMGSMETVGGASVRLPGDGADPSMGSADTLRPEGAPLGCIDQYALMRELGGGGFGTVYLARDTVAGIEVAVKGLPPLVKNNDEELERIRENFALVSRLHHPHIAAALVLHPAKDVSYADERARQALRVLSGDYLMVMAFAPGVTLSRWRKQFPEGKMPVPQALEVCRQIASALDYAHGERVAHRDVKPSNVMVETRGESSKVLKCGSSKVERTLNAQRSTFNAELYVRVLDFGLAAEIRSSLSRVSQEKGDTSGTRPYMAPEQWAGKKQDGRTDQYALAALFYELVSGAVPFASAFDTGDPVIMQSAVLNLKPEPLAGLTRAQNAALLRGLAKEPTARFSDCAALVVAFGGRASPLAVGIRRVAFGRGFRQWKRMSGRVLLMGVTVALAGGVVAGGAWVYRAYASYRQGQTEAVRMVALQGAKKETAERITRLLAEAETAFERKDYPKTSELLGNVLSEDGGNAAARKLNERVLTIIGPGAVAEMDVAVGKKVAELKAAIEDGSLDGAQGFAAFVDGIDTKYQAGAKLVGSSPAAAYKKFQEAQGAYSLIVRLQGERTAALKAREASDKNKAGAEKSGAVQEVPILWESANRKYVTAAALFGKSVGEDSGQFEQACEDWEKVADAYHAAGVMAETVASARSLADKARDAAEAVGANRDAAALWSDALKAEADAEGRWQEGEYAEACEYWAKAVVEAFARAVTYAEHVQSYSKAMEAYGAACSSNQALFEAFGGLKLAVATGLAEEAEQATARSDYSAGADAYRKALEALSGAKLEAEANKEQAEITKRVKIVENTLADVAKANAGSDWENVKEILDNLDTTPEHIGGKSKELTELKEKMSEKARGMVEREKQQKFTAALLKAKKEEEAKNWYAAYAVYDQALSLGVKDSNKAVEMKKLLDIKLKPVRDAKGAYERALSNIGKDIIEKYGGVEWNTIQKCVSKGDAPMEPVQAAEYYKQGVEQLDHLLILVCFRAAKDAISQRDGSSARRWASRALEVFPSSEATNLLMAVGVDANSTSWKAINSRWIKNVYKDNSVTMCDTETGIMWFADASENGAAGQHKSESVCRSLRYAGYGDWVLPKKEHLIQMYEQKNYFWHVKDDWYWSSFTFFHDAYRFNMKDGNHDYVHWIEETHDAKGRISFGKILDTPKCWIWPCRKIKCNGPTLWPEQSTK